MENNWLQVAMFLGAMFGMAVVVFWNNRANTTLINKVSASTNSVATALSSQEKPPKAEDIAGPIKDELKLTISGFFDSTLPIIQKQSTEIAELTVTSNQLRQEFQTYRSTTAKELEDLRCRLTEKEQRLIESNTIIETLRAELNSNRSEILHLQDRVAALEKQVGELVTEKEELQKERDAFKVRAETAEALVQKTLDENARLKKLLSDSEAGRAKAEAELLTRPPALPVAVRPDLPSDPSDPRV